MRKPFKMNVSWRLQRIYSPQLNFNIILCRDDLYSTTLLEIHRIKDILLV